LSSLQDAFQAIYQAVLTILATPEPQAQLPSIDLPPSEHNDMSSASYTPIPGTPGVTAPTPESSSVETSTKSNGYFSRRPAAGPSPGERSRTLDRTDSALRRRRTSQLASPDGGLGTGGSAKSPVSELGPDESHLFPANAAGAASKYTRHTFSRSPSPLGLIPIHRNWRKFVSYRHARSTALLSHCCCDHALTTWYLIDSQTRNPAQTATRLHWLPDSLPLRHSSISLTTPSRPPSLPPPDRLD